MREIFHSIFGVLLSNFHWFDPVTAFLFLYHFWPILGFDYQVWFRKWGPNPNPLFQFVSTFRENIFWIWVHIGFKLNLVILLAHQGNRSWIVDLSQFVAIWFQFKLKLILSRYNTFHLKIKPIGFKINLLDIRLWFDFNLMHIGFKLNLIWIG